MDLNDVLSRLYTLAADLKRISEKDQEQEVRGIALPVLDAVMELAKKQLGGDDPVVARVEDIISTESIEWGEPIRAIDALVAVNQLATALEQRRGPLQMTPAEYGYQQ